MTEADWGSCSEPDKMLDVLRAAGKLTERKARLFAVAVCRRIWNLLDDERSCRAVEVAEQFADEQVSQKDRGRAFAEAARVLSLAPRSGVPLAAHLYLCAAGAASNCAAKTVIAKLRGIRFATALSVGSETESAEQAALLRCVFGNPFNPPSTLAASVLEWNDGTVVQLAQSAYAERSLPAGTLAPDRLAVLADALEDAGCREPDLLGHCRQQGQVHVRGCFALDSILART